MNETSRYAIFHQQLNPGETLLVRDGVLCHHEAGIVIKERAVRGFKRYRNKSASIKKLVLSPDFPGDLLTLEINGAGYYLSRAAILALTPGLRLRPGWAGWKSWWVGSGLFHWRVMGKGRVWLAGYGHLVSRSLRDAVSVDQNHLLGYEVGTKLQRVFSGGLMASLLDKEGLVCRLSGKGTILTQSKSPKALAEWHNSRLRF